MNKVCLTGRICKDLELRYNSSNVSYTRFSLAANRNFKNQQGEYEADFINCVAWRERAEMMAKHLSKGSQIAIEGRIQTGKYVDKDGNNHYTSDIIVENITFLDSKKKENQLEPQETSPYDFQQNSNLHSQRQDYVENDPYLDFGDCVRLDDEFLD